MKNRFWRWFWTIFAGISITALAVSCGGKGGDTTGVNMALDWFPWSNHSGMFVAIEKGYFEDEGLDVNIYTPADPATVLQTVAAGRDDFGISYQVEVLLAREQGVPVVSIAALVQHPLNSVMTLKESGIVRPRELKGKTIGYPGLPSDTAMLRTMLENDGISIDDVTLVNIGFDLVPVLIGKRVDAILGAYWVHESISAELQGYPVNIMRLEEWGLPDFYELVLVTSERKLKEDPEQVQGFLRAIVKGYDEAVRDPQAAVDVLLRAHPEVNADIERPGVELLAPLWKEGDVRFGWQTDQKWSQVAGWMKANDILSKDVDTSKAFTNQFVEGVK